MPFDSLSTPETIEEIVLDPETVRVKTLLEETLKLLKKGWCRRSYAQTKNRRRTCPGAVDAVKFCAMGAIIHASENLGYSITTEIAATSKLLETIYPQSEKYHDYGALQLWNDHVKSKKEVLTAFQDTIQGLSNEMKSNIKC